MSLRTNGMIRFFFIVSLCVTQALSVRVETIYGQINERITLSGEVKNAVNCSVVTNNGDDINFKNVSSIEADIAVVNRHECALSLRLTANREGLWMINSTFGNESGQNVTKQKSFYVNVKNIIKKEDVLPSREITVTDGNYAIAYLETHENMTTCTLLDQHGLEYNISAIEQNKSEFNFITEYEQCGVRMKVNDSHVGEWKLLAHLGRNETRTGSFKIKVIDKPNKIKSVKDMYAEVGSKSYRLIFDAPSAVYCEIKDPRNNVVVKKQGSCMHDIPIVTSYHRGSWFATYYTKGHLIERYSEIRLHTFDASKVNATVTYDKSGNIQLLCRYSTEVRITVCRFEDPQNNVILVNPGTGTEKYEYYGKGFGSSYFNNLYQDCGITIREPTDHDFGTWRCLVNVKDKSTHEGSILHVQSQPDAFQEVTIGNKVYVQQGFPFKIICKAQSALKYCSIKSPNGTIYFTTTRKELLPKSVAYEGAGLELGECGAKLPGANFSDDGDWSCHMGLQRGPELEARVPVIVTESSIMAVEDRIELSSADMPITLSCVPIPGSEFDIDYCRWIKPDGTIVQSEMDAQNLNETNHQYCKITITDDKYANIGKWTCIVGIKYGVDSEAQADIFVYYNSNSVYFILLGSCFLISAVAILAFFIYRNNNRQKMKDYLIDFKM